jgi:sulfotransferase
VIACVRNVAWVMDSIERLYRKNPYENTALFGNDAERSTVFSRTETLAQRNRLVGLAYSGLKEAYYSEQGRAMLVVDYDLLVQRPAHVIPLIYQFLGEETFASTTSTTCSSTRRITTKASAWSVCTRCAARSASKPRETILPPDLFEQYSKLSFWYNTASSRCNVLMVRP